MMASLGFGGTALRAVSDSREFSGKVKFAFAMRAPEWMLLRFDEGRFTELAKQQTHFQAGAFGGRAKKPIVTATLKSLR